MEDQLQSPLFRLPVELREQIYELTLTAQRPFTDPRIGPLIRSPYTDRPAVGVGILRTCRKAYEEVDASTLYLNNTLRFTNPRMISAFLQRLPAKHRQLLHGVTIDLRTLGTDDIMIQRTDEWQEWTHYLFCTRDSHPRVYGCLPYNELLQVDLPPPIHRWIAFDITIWQQRITAGRRALPRSTTPGAVERMITSLRKILRRTWALFLVDQSQTRTVDDALIYNNVKVKLVGLDEQGLVSEAEFDLTTGTHAVPAFLLKSINTDTGRLKSGRPKQ